MYQIYILVIHLLLPIVVIRHILLGITNRGYRRGWRERFGFVRSVKTVKKIIWIHAVSVGEVQASRPLVEYLQGAYPQYAILMTTVTPGGAEAVNRIYYGTVTHRYLPYDVPYCVDRFLRVIQPSVLLVMETEIWPVLYFSCHDLSIPIALINARLSIKSLSGYRLVSGLTRLTLGKVTVLAAQTQADAERFISLGAEPGRVSVTGSLKFDVTMPGSVNEEAESVKQVIGKRPVWIAASTHEGEEEMVLESMSAIIREIPDCLLIIAPRHPERSQRIYKLCRNRGFDTCMYSDPDRDMGRCQIFILDTLGQLPCYYAVSDIAFVGGSFVKIGGHNLIEPASLGLPVISGRHVFNFQHVSSLLEDVNALRIVADTRELADMVVNLLKDNEQRQLMGERGREAVLAHQGKINKLTGLLEGIIP
jgi:3-deoxy-D-manno-octulosonic-acid transferase